MQQTKYIPQGSHVGPRIFNIFLNDLLYFLEGLCQITNYDDHDINVIKNDLELASEVAIQWIKDNFMKANASKCLTLCVSRTINPPILQLCIDDVVIRNESHVKLVGSTLTNDYLLTIPSQKCANKLAIK